jgi:ubiquinone/menaquinone biosynthesis C-methylase UbiE
VSIAICEQTALMRIAHLYSKPCILSSYEDFWVGFSMLTCSLALRTGTIECVRILFHTLLPNTSFVSVELLTMDPLASRAVKVNAPAAAQFENTFHIEDLEVFDDDKLRVILSNCGFGLTVEKLARSLHGASEELIQRIKRNLLPSQRSRFMYELRKSIPEAQVEVARRCVLDGLFWELTYWKTPDLYEELIDGEQLHPGIFRQLEPDIHDKVVLDVGAGSGRASFECARYDPRKVYAVEPSPGLLRILQQKLASQPGLCCIVPYQGSFDKLPLTDDSVETALSCSAFTSDPAQGGEPGLAEFRRVIKPGGKIVIIWPRVQDYDWLAEHGFRYVALPMCEEMQVRFRTLQSALRCARHFYAHNPNVVEYILSERKLEIPFSILGFNPPCDYCWLLVE